MPVIGSKGAASSQGFGQFALTAAGPSNWFLSSSRYNTNFGYGISLDGANNIYCSGYSRISKFTPSGIFTASYESNYSSWIPVHVASSGVVYSGTSAYSSGYQLGAVAQWSSNLSTINFANQFGTATSGFYADASCVTTDSSGNYYVGGYFNTGSSPTTANACIVKYTSSGTYLADYQFNVASNDYANDVGSLVVDGSGNIYAFGTNTTGAYAQAAVVTKFNSSGVIQWSSYYRAPAQAFRGALDSAGNLYGVVRQNYGCQLVKFNSSGTFQWAKQLTYPASYDGYFYAVAVDSSDNIYISGITDATNGQKGIVVKFDSSGTVLWQRTIAGTYPYISLNAITTIGTDYVVSGAMDVTGGGSPNYAFMARLPQDGTKTGTYGQFTYASSSFTITSGTDTHGSFSYVSAANSLNRTTGTTTTYNSPYTVTKTTVT